MLRIVLLLAALGSLHAQGGAYVLLVVNGNDASSRQVAEYYRPRRSIPVANVCTLATTSAEEITWDVYQRQIETPVANCLKRSGLVEQVLYIVTTQGVPLKVDGAGTGMSTDRCSVDSELALLYGKLKGVQYPRAGGVANPFFHRRDIPFTHTQFPIYLVTRLAAYDVADVKAMIDRSLAAHNRGKFVIDLSSAKDDEGNNWLRTAAILLPEARVVLDESTRVLYEQKDVIGYAGWGSNDDNRKRRMLGFSWLPGAVATEYVSTSARTLQRPPDAWTYATWTDKSHWFAGSPQGLSADLIHEGATGASGNTYEPFLGGCVRPDYLLPAYYSGRNLAESYYLGMPLLSWQGVVFGDPLCSLGKP
ncbi:MAG TPA: TIGR03790 family protein [Verrucomicrobiae bacterium]|nr:TIGR03790 family protein [Verrucomicrobiae bacterium]